MTTVIVYRDKEQHYKGFTCMGHANFAKKSFLRKSQPDILCAGISILVQTTIGALEDLACEDITFVDNEETGFIKCDFNKNLQEKSVFLLDSMVYGLEALSESYGRTYLQVNFEEV
ncbi:ribosomal-processing cysteine protease Prp [Lachnospiraceae bacterium OttesenSCG-928-D06]|nr:ribosomal-processing cysteine protease Prp [Lachnospiraceae bacterium OttesenSCG-928-D06]